MSGAEKEGRMVCVVGDNTLSEFSKDVRPNNIAGAEKPQHGPGGMIISVI